MQAADALGDIIRSRRTIGVFTSEPVDQNLVRQAIELACWAPNHRKTEPWRFSVLGPETQRQVIDLNASVIAAKKGTEAADTMRSKWSVIPGWIMVSCVKSADAFLAEEDYAATCCAVQNLMLSLWSNGIGTKWSTGDITRHEDFLRLAGINPEKERSVGLIWYGRPESVPPQSRRPVDEIARFLP